MFQLLVSCCNMLGSSTWQVDTRSNLDLLEAVPGGLRAAVDVACLISRMQR